MKCNSCGIEIPPIFSNSLKTNICPACSGPIMQQELQGLIEGLAEAMLKMPHNPQGVACWLVSNYKMVKVNDYDPIDKFFDGKSQQAPSNQQTAGFQNQTTTAANNTSKLQDFFARAGVKPENLANSNKPKQQQQFGQPLEDVIPASELAGLDDVDKMMLMGSDEPISDYEKDALSMTLSQSQFGNDSQMLPYYQQLEQKKMDMQNSVNGGGATNNLGKPSGFRRV